MHSTPPTAKNHQKYRFQLTATADAASLFSNERRTGTMGSSLWEQARIASLKRAVQKWVSCAELNRHSARGQDSGDSAPARPADSVAVLGLLPDGHDAETLWMTSLQQGWQLIVSHSLPEGLKLLKIQRPGLVLADHHLIGPDWQHALHTVLVSHFQCCVLLISERADDLFWESVIREGGYDVLSSPLTPANLIRAVQFAWNYRQACANQLHSP